MIFETAKLHDGCIESLLLRIEGMVYFICSLLRTVVAIVLVTNTTSFNVSCGFCFMSHLYTTAFTPYPSSLAGICGQPGLSQSCRSWPCLHTSVSVCNVESSLFSWCPCPIAIKELKINQALLCGKPTFLSKIAL